MADQFNESCLSAFGHPDVRTPNLDKLVRGGVAFRNCYSCSAICLPSRLSSFTGQYIHTHGVMANDRSARVCSPNTSMARHLKETLGYTTAAIGKLHLGTWEPEAGFDHVVYTEGPGSPENHYFEYLKKNNLYEVYEKFLVKDKNILRRFTAGDSKIPTRHSNESFTADQTMRLSKGAERLPSFAGPLSNALIRRFSFQRISR